MSASDRDTVLVTGSSGFLGGRLARRLKRDFHVVGLDVKEPEGGPEPDTFVPIDLSSEEGVNGALDEVARLRGRRIASVVHLAAYFDLSGEPDERYDEITVGGTRRLVAGLDGFDVDQFVMASTMLIHKGTEPGERISEASPIDAEMPYEASKVACEKLVAAARGDMRAVFLRIAGVYDDPCRQPFIAHQIARIYERSLKSHFYPADLATGQSFVHVDDLAEAVSALVARRSDLPAELPLLVGEEDVVGYGEMQDMIGHLLHGEDWTTVEVPQIVAKAGAAVEDAAADPFIKPWMVDFADESYAVDASRARTLLDWKPKRSLRTVLPDMIAALKRDPRGWYETNGLDPERAAA